MLITRTPAFTCPCGNVLNATASTTIHRMAQPGDFTICFVCERVYVFDQSMQLTELTEDRVANELTSDEAASIIAAMEQLHAVKAKYKEQQS